MRRKTLRLVGGNTLTSVFSTFDIFFRFRFYFFFLFLVYDSMCSWCQVENGSLLGGGIIIEKARVEFSFRRGHN